jgi:hypothetical protein
MTFNPFLWNRGALIGWALIFICLLGYELWCVLSGDAETPPLTYVVVEYVPWPIPFVILFWLVLHFAMEYARRKGISI